MTKERSWQPMASAPKDGRRVLMANSARDDGMHVCYWDAYYAPDGRGYDGGDGWVVDAAGEEYRTAYGTPTHWMPLPLPPEPGSVTEKQP